MTFVNHIINAADRIRKTRRAEKAIVAIAGAGCIGKSTLAHRIQDAKGSTHCQILSLDGYMMERQTRENLGGLSGYDPTAFELPKARRQLLGLVRDRIPFEVFVYSRKTHKRDTMEIVEPKELVVVEGGLALRAELYDLADLHVFIEADRRTQRALRVRREMLEFGYSVEETKRRCDRYQRDYMKFVAPQKLRADIVYYVNSNYELKVSTEGLEPAI